MINNIKDLIRLLKYKHLEAKALFQTSDDSDAMHDLESCDYALDLIARGEEELKNLPNEGKWIKSVIANTEDIVGEKIKYNSKKDMFEIDDN